MSTIKDTSTTNACGDSRGLGPVDDSPVGRIAQSSLMDGCLALALTLAFTCAVGSFQSACLIVVLRNRG